VLYKAAHDTLRAEQQALCLGRQIKNYKTFFSNHGQITAFQLSLNLTFGSSAEMAKTVISATNIVICNFKAGLP
jgi:hypothetical protein